MVTKLWKLYSVSPRPVCEWETPGSPTIKTAMCSIAKKFNECIVLYVGVVSHDLEFSYLSIMWSKLMSVCALTLCDHLLLIRVKIHIILIVLWGPWDRAACCRVLSTLLLCKKRFNQNYSQFYSYTVKLPCLA